MRLIHEVLHNLREICADFGLGLVPKKLLGRLTWEEVALSQNIAVALLFDRLDSLVLDVSLPWGPFDHVVRTLMLFLGAERYV